jgi:hypothetical protein
MSCDSHVDYGSFLRCREVVNNGFHERLDCHILEGAATEHRSGGARESESTYAGLQQVILEGDWIKIVIGQHLLQLTVQCHNLIVQHNHGEEKLFQN